MRIIEQLGELPDLVRQTLGCAEEVRRIAEKYAGCNNFLYLGRQFNFPTALEGALKLKEISYIHAEGYPAAEMKHGPIALVDRDTPSVFVMPQRAALRQGAGQRPGDQGPRRTGYRRGRPGATGGSTAWPTT